MNIRDKFLDRIKKKEKEIIEYENKIREAKSYIQALQDSIKMLPKEGTDIHDPERLLRPGSMASKTYELLKERGEALHIKDILRGLALKDDKKARVSLSGTLGSYCRKNMIFNRTAPNTFSLIRPDDKENEDKLDEFDLSEEDLEKLEFEDK